MKRKGLSIVIKAVFFLGVIGAVTGYVSEKYAETLYYKTANGCYKFQNVPLDIEVANLGASQSLYGFEYDVFEGYQAMNFALAAQTFEYDYAIAETYISHIKKGAVMYIPIALYSMYQQGDEIDSIQYRYYEFLPDRNNPGWNFNDAILYEYFPALTAGNNLLKIFNDDTEIPDVDEKLPNGYVQDDEMRVYAGIQAAEIHKEYIGEQKLSKQYLYLVKIIELCQKNDITPIMLVMPYTQEYIDAFDDAFWNKFYKDIQNTSEQYQCELYDYTKSDFCRHPEYFNDTTHMTKKGSIAFSEDILERTISDGYLEEK